MAIFTDPTSNLNLSGVESRAPPATHVVVLNKTAKSVAEGEFENDCLEQKQGNRSRLLLATKATAIDYLDRNRLISDQ